MAQDKASVRILAIMSNLSAGGAETMYMNLYRKLDKTRYKIDFLVFGGPDAFYSEEVKRNGSKILQMSSVQEAGIRGFAASIRKAIVENGPYDIVHSHIDYLSGIAMRIAKRCNIKIRLAHSHNTSASTYRGALPSPLLFVVRRLITKNATQTLACSFEAAEYMFGRKCAAKTYVINNAIDLNRFSERGQYGETLSSLRGSGKKIILHVGRFVDTKNHRALIRIFYEYHKKHGDAMLLLVGDGELKDEIARLVHEYQIQDSVLFLGLRSDIPELLSASDVFVLPSKFEGLPVTLIEAQAMNVPCVVSDNVKPAVDCGLNLIKFIPPENEDAWIDEIEKAIQGRVKKNNYEVMSERGYNIDDNVRIIEELYSGGC